MNLISALALIQKYDMTITELSDEGYRIECGYMAAILNADSVTYYVTDVYNSGSDYAEIDMENLEALKNVVGVLRKELQ